jgi:hypothetical protein
MIFVVLLWVKKLFSRPRSFLRATDKPYCKMHYTKLAGGTVRM